MTVAKVPSVSTLQWARVGQARRFIRAHATEALTLERIAREAMTSPFHFSRMFRALTGETVFHAHIGRAFDAVFRGWVSQAGVALRPAPCLEIYVDNARGVTPRDRVTELCVPIER